MVPNATTQSRYRLDPVHTRRNLFTPRAYGLDRVAITPNFVSRDATTGLQFVAGPNKPGALFTAPQQYPLPQVLGSGSDFEANNVWVNKMARLGSVNLNRPLADYRTNTGAALSNTNVGNAAQAEIDRQKLAQDIFVRLVAALGAAANVDATTGAITLPAPAGTADYQALRYLAQVAVNLVDYIDNDDISTTFVWNPTNNLANDMRDVEDRVVFGVEKPRLLLNEVYAETTNAPGDMPQDTPPAQLAAGAEAHVKFWAELVNATSAPHTAGPGGPLGTGAVNLSAYQIQISRATVGMANRAGFLNDPSNTTGRFQGTADATFTFPPDLPAPTIPSVVPNNATYTPPGTLPNGGFVLVGPPVTAAKMPADKEFNPPDAGIWSKATNKVESGVPTAATASKAMGYTIPMPAATELSKKEMRRHVVLLRRLTNPHLPVNDPNAVPPMYDSALPVNTYVTVDAIDYVPAFDAVHRASRETMDREERSAMKPNGFDPVAERFSVGKVQPLAGLSFASRFVDGPAKYNEYNGNTNMPPAVPAVASTLTSSMVRDQTSLAALPTAPTNPNEPRNTFGRHNGNSVNDQVAPGAATIGGTALTDTLMRPFDWLPHFDRPLDTLGDVFHVRDCAPHRLTADFVTFNGAALNYDASYARWRQHEDGLARRLAFLTVKSPDYRVGHGGRTAGQVNVNVLQDSRVAQGVWDAPAGGALFNPTFVNDNVWERWMNSRTPLQTRLGADNAGYRVPVPNQRFDATINPPTGAYVSAPTLLDDVTGVDRPFLPYGAPVAIGAAGVNGFAYPGTATNTEDTILRRDPAPWCRRRRRSRTCTRRRATRTRRASRRGR